MRMVDALSTLVIAIIQPMMEASKGAVLKVVNVTQNSVRTADGNTAIQVVADTQNKALFDDKSVSRHQAQVGMNTIAS